MRTETSLEGQTTVILIDLDGQIMITYMPEQNIAIEMTFSPDETPIDEVQAVPDFNPIIIGNETLDGKVCLVVQYDVDGVRAKMWIWQDYGFPIRMESTTTEGTVIIEYKNIEFTDIPDSIFQLPEGVQIMDIPIPGM